MGNAGSNARERHKPGESGSSSQKDSLPQAFVFDKKKPPLLYQDSTEDEDVFYTKGRGPNEDEHGLKRQVSATASTTSEGSENKVLPTVFKWEGGGKQVFISGTFSEWKPIPMVKSHGDFVTIVDLPEGEHQFKYFVDGEWKYDPSVNVVNNDLGSKNNVVTVKNTDFEIFQALDMDGEIPPSCSSEGSDGFSQNIPTAIRPWEKVPGPPILPPHLLQVILNKDTPLSCEPTLLPEPNHVMLNHLYALSIKDGVMVLSATHRYRKKYVTTLLYKPI